VNLLVTNTGTPQAYALLRALRPRARRIVATIDGDSVVAALRSHAAFSRLVDHRVRVPSPVAPWRAGRIDPSNSQEEEAYVRAVLALCEREGIDVVYPSWDPHVYVLCKNKARLADAGVLLPFPDYEVVIEALDKLRTVRAAETIGVACPRTLSFDGSLDAPGLVAELGLPLVVKRRFTSGGRGLQVLADLAAVEKAAASGAFDPRVAIVQEFIPGARRQAFHLVLDRDGQARFRFQKLRRQVFRANSQLGTVSVSSAPDAYFSQAAALLTSIRWWGGAGVETLIDPRDGRPKLLEINARFPRQLWNRTELGINEPWMCIEIARGRPVDTVSDVPEGITFVNPVEEAQVLGMRMLDLLVYRVRTALGRTPLDPRNVPTSMREQVDAYKELFGGGGRRVLDPYLSHFLQDPVVAVLWWMEFATWVAGLTRQLGR